MDITYYLHIIYILFTFWNKKKGHFNILSHFALFLLHIALLRVIVCVSPRSVRNSYICMNCLFIPLTLKCLCPPGSAPDELLSSSSIFDHVDRLSRGSSDGTRRQNNNKVQLIAMQPRVPQPHLSPSLTERVSQEVRETSALPPTII